MICLKVVCSGDGLRMGTLGKDIKSFIDTRKAGPGELNLHCVGPHGKTAYCELNDHQDGTFTLHLKPQVCIKRLTMLHRLFLIIKNLILKQSQ